MGQGMILELRMPLIQAAQHLDTYFTDCRRHIQSFHLITFLHIYALICTFYAFFMQYMHNLNFYKFSLA